MKKLLVAGGNKNLSKAAIDFACYLARLTNSGLTGVFLETLQHEEKLKTSVEEGYLQLNPVLDTSSEANTEVRSQCDEQIDRFKKACISCGVTGIAHRDRLQPWKELRNEMRFADALIMDSDFSLRDNVLESFPGHDAKKLLHEAECPVIIAPLSFEGLEEIILSYDGSASSIYAIRQFVHLLQELNDLRVTVLEIWPDEDEHPKELHRLKEWLNQHFRQVDSVVLKGDIQPRLVEYLMAHPNAFIVMGGFGRSRISRMLQPSISGAVVKLVSSPIFIAHG